MISRFAILVAITFAACAERTGLGGAFAVYDVPTGNVTISQSGCSIIFFRSLSKSLNPENILNQRSAIPADAYVPTTSTLPQAKELVAWEDDPFTSLGFESLKLLGAAAPGLPASDFHIFFFHPGEFLPTYGYVFVTPEPLAVSLATIGLISLAALRRRK